MRKVPIIECYYSMAKLKKMNRFLMIRKVSKLNIQLPVQQVTYNSPSILSLLRRGGDQKERNVIITIFFAMFLIENGWESVKIRYTNNVTGSGVITKNTVHYVRIQKRHTILKTAINIKTYFLLLSYSKLNYLSAWWFQFVSCISIIDSTSFLIVHLSIPIWSV